MMSSHVQRYVVDSGGEGELPTLRLDIVLTHEEGKTPFDISKEIVKMINERIEKQNPLNLGNFDTSKINPLNI